MTEPKYDEDVVNLGYLNKVIEGTEEAISEEYKSVTRHYGSQPQPPYYEGDTWIDRNIVYTCINTRKIGTYQSSDWTTESGATELATKKNQVFLRQPSNYNAGDMWILQTDTDHRNGKRGEILIATVGRAVYDEGDWVNMLVYGTQASINEIASNLNSAIDRIGVTEEAIADGIIITFYQNTIPEGKHIGDLWYVTDTLEDYIKGKIYRYNGSEWQLLNDPDIEKAFNEANKARIIADGKIQSFYSAEEPTKDMGLGDLWIDTDDNNKLYRYNGTNWIPVYDTRVDTVVGKIENIETEQEQTAEELIEVNKSLTIIRSAAEAAQTGAAQAQKSADEANSKVAEALEETSQIRTEVAEAKEDIGNVRTEVSGQIETLSNTMEANYSKKTDLASTESTLRTEISQSATQIQTTVEQTYAKKTDLTEVESSLQTQITQNSEEIKSTASSVTRIDADVLTAKQDIITAQTTADNAKSAATEAEKNLNIAKENLSKLQTQANATDEQLSAAKQEIEAAEIAVGNAQKAAEAAQKKADDTYKELDALDKRVTNNETAISQKADSVTVTAIQTQLDDLEEIAATKSELKVATDSITSRVSNTENYINNAKNNYGYQYKADITIYGDSDKYYPVVIKGGKQDVMREILVYRAYSEQAPSDWNTSTHKGALTVKIKCNFGGWGGTTYQWWIHELNEQYSRTFASACNCGQNVMFAIFLRGGGENGAVYHLYSDQPLNGANYSSDDYPNTKTNPQICYDSDLIFYNKNSTNEYKYYAPAPRTLTDTIKAEIESKKYIDVASNTAKNLADNYSTTTQMNSAISQKAEQITSTVSSTYITKTDSANNISTAKTEAINSANSSTDEKLKNYSTTTQMNSTINQKANEINLEVYKKVGNDEIISKINQSAEDVSIQANKISLEGIVTANKNFKILTDGSMEAKNGKFTGGKVILESSTETTGDDAVFKIIDTNISDELRRIYMNPSTLYIDNNGNHASISSTETDSSIEFLNYGTIKQNEDTVDIYTLGGMSASETDMQGHIYLYSGEVTSGEGTPKSRIDMFSDNNESKIYLENHNEGNNYLTITPSSLEIESYNTSRPHIKIIGSSDMEPQISITNGTYEFGLLIGSGGVNRGIWDYNYGKWWQYFDSEKTYICNNCEANGGIKLCPNGIGDTISTWEFRADGGLYSRSGGVSGSHFDQYGNIVLNAYNSNNSNSWSVSQPDGTALFTVGFSSGSITIQKGILYHNGETIRCKKIYELNNVTNATNLYVTSNGYFRRTSNTSSKRYKTDIKSLENEELDPNKLYDLEVKQFKYKEEYQPNEKDSRYNKTLIGFIAEEMAEIFPIAVDYTEEGEIDNWNEKYMIPAMLKLIQDHKKKIDELEQRILILENRGDE